MPNYLLSKSTQSEKATNTLFNSSTCISSLELQNCYMESVVYMSIPLILLTSSFCSNFIIGLSSISTILISSRAVYCSLQERCNEVKEGNNELIISYQQDEITNEVYTDGNMNITIQYEHIFI